MTLTKERFHGVAGGNIWQKPERVLKIGQQTHIGVGERRSRSGSQIVMGLGSILTSDNIQSGLHLVFMFELGSIA